MEKEIKITLKDLSNLFENSEYNLQPDSSKREDSTYDKKKDDEMGQYYAQRINIVEMRYSEHDSNAVREVQ